MNDIVLAKARELQCTFSTAEYIVQLEKRLFLLEEAIADIKYNQEKRK